MNNKTNNNLMTAGVLVFVLSLIALLLLPILSSFVNSSTSLLIVVALNVAISLFVFFYGIAKSIKLFSGTLFVESIILPITNIISLFIAKSTFCVNSPSCPAQSGNAKGFMLGTIIVSVVILTLFFVLTAKNAKKG